MRTEPGILKEDLGTFPSVFVATETRYFTGVIEPPLAVFTAMKVGVLMEILEYFQPCLWQPKPYFSREVGQHLHVFAANQK